MESTISEYLTILANNKYVGKYKDIPEEIDNRDQILAIIDREMDGTNELPNWLIYFEINGFSQPVELKDYLEKYFNQFKVDYLKEVHNKNKSLMQEIANQFETIKNSLEKAVYETNQIQDDDLHELIGIKIGYLDELNKFLSDPKTYVNGSITTVSMETVENKQKSYNWLKGQKELNDLFENMKASNLISAETQSEDFKAVFTEKDLSTLKPIQWEKGPRLLAYFIDQLTENKYIPRTPKWSLLKYCFTYSSKQDGNYVPALQNIKSQMHQIKTSGKPKYARLVDSLFTYAPAKER